MISAAALSAQSRANVQVAGSSTVLPCANIVAEAFGAEFATPVVEGGGLSTGRRMLCVGGGEGPINIANSSSLMRDSGR